MGEAEDHAERMQAEAIARLRLAYLECRTIGHAWRIRYIGPTVRADEEIATTARHHKWRPDGCRILRCSRCHTERIDLCLVGYGRREYSYRMVSRFYRYPKNYAIEGGIGGSRDPLHEEIFRRYARGDT